MTAEPASLSPEQAEIMNRWLGDGVARSEQREALHRLAAGVRTLARDLVQVEAEAADVGDFLVAEDLLGRLQHAVGALPQIEATPATAPLPTSYLFERSPVSGASNALAPPLRMRFGNPTVAQVVYDEQYEGPPGGVHGGVVAAAMDEVLGIAQMASGAAGFTGTLEVRYLAVTPLHTLVTYTAEVDHLDGRKLYMRCRSEADGSVRAEATAVFITKGTVAAPDAYSDGTPPPPGSA